MLSVAIRNAMIVDGAGSKDDIGAPAVRVPVTGLPAFGNAGALVTIVAFTDYECPYCLKADKRIETLRAEYGDRLRLVIGSHPLPMHDHAAPAARAFLAAVEQGKGEEMHAKLFVIFLLPFQLESVSRRRFENSENNFYARTSRSTNNRQRFE